MLKRRPLFLATTTLFLAASPAFADDASKTAKVEEFLKLAKMDDALRQGLALASNQIKSGMLQQMTGTKLSPEQEKRMGEFQDKVTALVSSALSWEKMKPSYVQLYADAYTEPQLDDILAFYRSPSGQAMVAGNSSLMTKTSAIAQKQLAEVMPELQKLIRDFGEPTKPK
jgi:hypothetical protein